MRHFQGCHLCGIGRIARRQIGPPLRDCRPDQQVGSHVRILTSSHCVDQSDDSLQHGRASLAGGLQDPGPSATADTSRHTDSPEQSTNHGSDYFVEFLSRPFVDVIIRLFFESVYPLLPYPHRPSFLHDIETRRETQPNQDEWCTLVVSVVGFTLVQVPNRLTGHSREQLRSLVEKCFAHCRNFLQSPGGLITVDRSEFWTVPNRIDADIRRCHLHVVRQASCIRL